MKFAILSLISILLVSCSSIQTLPHNPSIFNESEFIDKFGQFWNQHNVASLAELFTEDTTWISIVGQYWQGKTSISEQIFHLFQGDQKNNQLVFENIKSKKIKKDIILLIADWQLNKRVERYGVSYIRKRKGILSFILVSDEKGYWKISFAQGTLKFKPLR